ncbi:EamA family transporter [Flavobacterium sp. RHBU_24]|uniref:EamA family transporter n=1 Tax=Flavobacterium sp. RHBU_24 TaxID=3391185 RepID=UPI003985432F
MIRNTQIIFCNYAVALLLCYLFFAPKPSVSLFQAHWPVYVPLMILLPSVFIFLAASVRKVGIVRTDAAQRLSLFIPILAAWFIFKENFTPYKVAGLIIGFPALGLILAKKSTASNNAGTWLFPIVVLLGFGIVDTLFKKVVTFSEPNYTTSLFMVFIGAIIITFFAMLYEIFILKKTNFSIMNIAYGALVGIFNFGNILFYLQAHQEFSNNPSTVFAAMNMGVIVTGSLAGVLIFGEKLSLKNYVGIVLALLAIVFIALSQLYA